MFVVVLLVSCSLQFACAGGQINKSSQPPLVIVSLDGMDWRILKNHRFTPNLVTRGGGDSHMKQTGMLAGNFEFNP